MKDHNQHEIQMSEAFLNSAFLALSGGFQDAYTYNARNEVFCNAQTGNVVLMSQHFMAGELMAGSPVFLAKAAPDTHFPTSLLHGFF